MLAGGRAAGPSGAAWLRESMEAELAALAERGLERRLDPVRSRRGARIRLSGRTLVNFGSNDYLGLGSDPSVARRAAAAATRWGSGSGASRLLSGDLELHGRLESALARFKSEEAATIFPSGYMANLGAVCALADERDVVLVDRLNHASLIDAARLSGAKLWVYPHKDLARLDELLGRASDFRRRLVLSDAYFSMDGDTAPVRELAAVCSRHQAILMLDEAHSTGVFGPRGRGLIEEAGMEGHIDVVMGTLSKALGSVGGFIAGSGTLKRYLGHRARTLIYTTAPSPYASSAALEALRVMTADPTRRLRLWRHTERLRGALEGMGYDLMGSRGPIIPVRTGSTAKAVEVRGLLRREGHYVPAIRPPTVPKGSDRLRISLRADLADKDIDALIRSMKKLRGRLP